MNTLAIDIGGTGLKASVLAASGQMLSDRVRIPTPYPLSPQGLVAALQGLIAPLPPAERASVGFPGVVREGRIRTAPHFLGAAGPDAKPQKGLVTAWSDFDLAGALTEALGKPTRVANDADVQGAGVVSGTGIELVVTLGTGVGTALFVDGQVCPHLELGHHPLRRGETYNERLGEAARKKVGNAKWRRRVLEAVDVLDVLVNFDRLYIGGGNAQRLPAPLPERVMTVSNDAGILGGIKLWDRRTFALGAHPRSRRATTSA
ncbi:MAG: ROK family protein [Actinomycetota bacterium]|nr:ROK family protein [Actinomycetota bacterium]